MSIKPWLGAVFAFALALGGTGCVTEGDEEPPPSDEDGQVEVDQLPTTDEPGDYIPGEGDDTCGGAQLKADGTCTGA